jgi:hypothetical protein
VGATGTRCTTARLQTSPAPGQQPPSAALRPALCRGSSAPSRACLWLICKSSLQIRRYRFQLAICQTELTDQSARTKFASTVLFAPRRRAICMETGAREMADEMEVVEEHVSAVAKGDAGDAPAVAALATPWVEKYRPETLGDVIAHTDIVSTRKPPRPARRAPPQQRYWPALPPPPPPPGPCSHVLHSGGPRLCPAWSHRRRARLLRPARRYAPGLVCTMCLIEFGSRRADAQTLARSALFTEDGHVSARQWTGLSPTTSCRICFSTALPAREKLRQVSGSAFRV